MHRVRVVKRKTIYLGRIIRLIEEQLVINGRPCIREIIVHPGAAVIVPMLDASRLIMVRQYRRAVDRELLELPAGTLDAKERPIDCARRELEEETGWRAKRLKRIGQFYTAPGIISEQITVFLAQGLSPGSARLDPDESVTSVVLTLRQAMAREEPSPVWGRWMGNHLVNLRVTHTSNLI